MALYAFDGTWNKNQPSDALDTNVVKFYGAHEGNKFHRPGPGTRFGWFGKLFGGIFGAGGKARIKEAFRELEKNFKKGDKEIDIIGFSRGGALALDFANKIHSDGVLGIQNPEIRFVGVWDVVASFGIPGNDVNLSYELTVPDNVSKCFHAMALDERRRTFVLERLVTNVKNAKTQGRVYEVWFRGVHSDIGGGNRNVGLSAVTLNWMYRRALCCGLKLSDEQMLEHTANSNSNAAIGTNFDPVENRWRTVRWNDVVHHSVSYRDGCNNPPIGLGVVDDDGKIFSKGFGA